MHLGLPFSSKLLLKTTFVSGNLKSIASTPDFLEHGRHRLHLSPRYGHGMIMKFPVLAAVVTSDGHLTLVASLDWTESQPVALTVC